MLRNNVPTLKHHCYVVVFAQTVLVRWTKGYTASGVVGEDLGQLLMQAIDKKFKVHCLVRLH